MAGQSVTLGCICCCIFLRLSRLKPASQVLFWKTTALSLPPLLLAMAGLAQMTVESLTSGEPASRRRRRDSGEAMPVSGSTDEMWRIVNATANLAIAEAKLSLDNENRIRNHGAALETVVETSVDCPIADLMIKAGSKYDAAIKSQKAAGVSTVELGAPDEWKFKAGMLGLAQALPAGAEKEAVTAIWPVDSNRDLTGRM